MIFNTIKMVNFKSHKNTIINLNKGINIIVGKNGAGKSTILEAISFALFKQHTAKKIDDLIRNNSKSMMVELEFTTNNGIYKVIREKKSNLKSSLLKKNGEEFINICNGDKEVAQQIEDILKIDSNLFLNAMYVRQGEISELIDKTPAEKKQLIAKLLGIDSFEVTWKNLSPYINEYEKRSIELKGKLYNSIDLENNYIQNKNNLIELYSIFQDKMSKKKQVQNEINDLEREVNILKKKKENFIELNNLVSIKEKELSGYHLEKKNIKSRLVEIKNAQNDILELKGCDEELNKYLDLEKEVLLNEQLKLSIEELGNNINRKETAISNFLNEVSLLLEEKVEDIYKVDSIIDNNIEELSNSILELSNNIRELEEANIVFKQEITTNNNSISKLNEVGSQCPICQSQISDKQRANLNNKYNNNILKNKELIDINNNKISFLQESKTNLDDKKQAFLYYKNRLMQIKETDNALKEERIKLSDIQGKYIDTDMDKDEIQKMIVSLKEQNKKYNELSGFLKNKETLEGQLDNVLNKINEVTNNIDSIKSKIQNISFDEEYYEQLLLKLNEKQNFINTIDNNLSEIKGQSFGLISQLKDISKKQNDLKKFSIEFDNILNYIDILNKIRDLYGKNGIQKTLRSISRPLIEAETKDIFNKFNFDYSDLYLDDDYNISVFGPEGESSSSMVSGGEKVAIALSLRLGITQAISRNELDSIILDEPTIHLDTSRKYELIDLLQNISLIPQMIIVTHESQLENVADNLIVVKKQNAISFVRS